MDLLKEKNPIGLESKNNLYATIKAYKYSDKKQNPLYGL